MALLKNTRFTNLFTHFLQNVIRQITHHVTVTQKGAIPFPGYNCWFILVFCVFFGSDIKGGESIFRGRFIHKTYKGVVF